MYTFFHSYFGKGCRKNVLATIDDKPAGYMEYDQYTVPDTVAVEPTIVAFLLAIKHMPMASRAILLNFFEEQLTQNHPQYLSELSHALYLTTFFEIALYTSLKTDHRTGF